MSLFSTSSANEQTYAQQVGVQGTQGSIGGATETFGAGAAGDTASGTSVYGSNLVAENGGTVSIVNDLSQPVALEAIDTSAGVANNAIAASTANTNVALQAAGNLAQALISTAQPASMTVGSAFSNVGPESTPGGSGVSDFLSSTGFSAKALVIGGALLLLGLVFLATRH